jgi:hypothetical protein
MRSIRRVAIVGALVAALFVWGSPVAWADPDPPKPSVGQQALEQAAEDCANAFNDFLLSQEKRALLTAALIQAGAPPEIALAQAQATLSVVAITGKTVDVTYQATSGGQVIHFGVSVGSLLVEIIAAATGLPGGIANDILQPILPCIEMFLQQVGGARFKTADCTLLPGQAGTGEQVDLRGLPVQRDEVCDTVEDVKEAPKLGEEELEQWEELQELIEELNERLGIDGPPPNEDAPVTPTPVPTPTPPTTTTCPDIPGGCPTPDDTFGSDGTSVLRDGVYYGIPEGAYCEVLLTEVPDPVPGTIQNGECVPV